MWFSIILVRPSPAALTEDLVCQCNLARGKVKSLDRDDVKDVS